MHSAFARICAFSLLVIVTSSHAQTIYEANNEVRDAENGQVAEAISSRASGPHIQLALLSEKSALVPGQTQYVAIQMRPDPQWHTYWRNPGDSGEAPRIDWAPSEGISFGEIIWPVPEAIPVAHLVNYGYSGSHLLMVPVSLDQDYLQNLGDKKGDLSSIEIRADLSWLVCKEDCIPGWATVALTLPVAQVSENSDDAALFAQAKANLPEAEALSGVYEINEDTIALAFSKEEGASSESISIFPFRNDLIDHAGRQQWVNTGDSTNAILPRGAYFDPSVLSDDPPRLDFLVKTDAHAFYVSAEPVDESALAVIGAQGTTDTSLSAVLLMLVFAFVGGLLLNVMPCVLPILSMKAMSLRHEQLTWSKKLAYSLGVFVCFNAFAALIVILQQGGEQLGWGFHMQSPAVIWLLAFLFTFIALLLLDIFSVGSSMAGLGNNLVGGDNTQSHFFTGLLAVIVASPCTAPFMAAALGMAFISSPAVSFLIFNALAFGFALPLSLLFIVSSVRKWLPKPGQWMLSFKHFLAFPMLFTVAWLLWIYAGQQGVIAQFILMCSLLAFALFAWLGGRSKRLGSYVSNLLMLLLLLLPFLPNSDLLNTAASKQKASLAKGKLPALAYNEQVLADLRDANEVVLVNMTADWCITCKVNEQVALNTEQVRDAISQSGITYMIGDWTNKNDEILSYLKEYKRAGVPLYVVYAGKKSKQVLPQILSPGIVTDALNQAQKELTNEN